MSFNPKYSNSNKLVRFISEIVAIQTKLSEKSLTLAPLKKLYFLTLADSVHYSTKIEGNPLTLKQVTTALESKSQKSQDRNLKEVINYARTRHFLESSTVKLKEEFLFESHKLLLHGMVLKSHTGHYRKAQNVIKEAGSNTPIYFPPEWTDVSQLMTDLFSWLRKALITQEISPLILSGIFHFQFVTIHPFMDGNGRLARLWSHYILSKHGFDFTLISAIEKQIEKKRSLYYEQLHQLQGNLFYNISPQVDLTSWLEFWLECLYQAGQEASQRITPEIAPSKEDFPTDRITLAIQFFKKHRKLKASEYADLCQIGRTQAVEDLNFLTQKKIIRKIGGGRSTTYIIN